MTASWAWAAASSSCVAKAVAAAAMAAAHADADDDDVDADADAGANAGVDEDAAVARLSGSACSPPYPWSCKQTKAGEDFRCVCASVCKSLCVFVCEGGSVCQCRTCARRPHGVCAVSSSDCN